MQPIPDPEIVRRWCRAGLDGLAATREEIDALNVYPVPDGDTGTNLFLTMEAAVAAAEECGPDGGLAEIMNAIARGALLGARGNSGIILAQMLRGVADVFGRPGTSLADGSALAEALEHAVTAAYDAVHEPVEGTILTVARAAGTAARSQLSRRSNDEFGRSSRPRHDGSGAHDRPLTRPAARGTASPARKDPSGLPGVALAAARAARDALAATPEQLDVLREAGVVDAGGRGLTVLLDAFDTVLTGRRPLPTPRRVGEHHVPMPAKGGAGLAGRSAGPVVRGGTTAHHPAGAPENATARSAGPAGEGDERPISCTSGAQTGGEVSGTAPHYEVMYLLDAADAAIPGLRSALSALGDSLVVVGGSGEWNVHVHVDDVGAAIEAGVDAGHPHRIRVNQLFERSAAEAPRFAPGRVVVAFAAGPGLAELFASAGAIVAPTGAGRRPSTAEMLAAVGEEGPAEVVILPNERDAVPVAEAAAAELRAQGRRVAVLPTIAQVQGLAAVAVHEPGRSFDADVVAMTTAAGHARHGAVTVAAREAVTMAGICQPGDVLGVVEGDFAVIGADLLDVARDVVQRMLSAGGELVTIVTGAGADAPLVLGVEEFVRLNHPEVDTVVYEGGQARYPLLLGVE